MTNDITKKSYFEALVSFCENYDGDLFYIVDNDPKYYDFSKFPFAENKTDKT